MVMPDRGMLVQTAESTMFDTCQRLVFTQVVNADGRNTASVYTAGAILPCGFRWGSANADQTSERDGITTTAPRLRLPLGTTITSRDRIRLTHRYGQVLPVPLVFQVAGEPMPGTTVLSIELSRVST